MSTPPRPHNTRHHAPQAIQSTTNRRRPLAAPSPALLSLLAAITPAVATPLALPTPDFLCPSLIPPTDPPRKRTRRPRAETPPAAPAPVASSSNTPSTTPFPVKYLSQSGTWYPAEVWSLHGKSRHQIPTPTASHSHSQLPPAPSGLARPGIDSVDDVISDPSSATSAMPTEFTDTLPTGWKPMPERTKFYSVPLIVVFSLILAVAITLVLAGTVLWHKNRRRPRDAERAKLDPDGAEEFLRTMRRAERGAAKKERMWGRWRREARAGLRRRRRKGRALEEEVEAEAPRSVESSPRVSMVSSRDDQQQHHESTTIFLSSMRAHEPNSVSRPPSPSPSPPAPPSTPPPSLRAESPVPPPAPAPSPQRAVHSPPAYRRLSRSRRTPPASPSPEPPPPDPPAAHVATDDKAVLARLHSHASAPAHAATDAVEPGAPQWEDERLEDFGDTDADGAGPSCTLPLPSPPPKLRYYAHEDDDDEGEVVVGPSAPPFAPSAPPSFEPSASGGEVPSAPPAEEEEEEAAAPSASAPPLEEEELEAVREDPLPPPPRLPRYSP